MEKNLSKTIAKNAMVSALYVVLTIGFGFMSYGPVQFRVAEMLTLLVFYDRKYFIGLVIGCVISNMFSPLGMLDVVVGSFSTILSLISIILTRKYFGDSTKVLIVSSFAPVLFNGIIIGLELTYLFKELPYMVNVFYVAIGEFVVVTVFGTFVFSKIKDKIKSI